MTPANIYGWMQAFRACTHMSEAVILLSELNYAFSGYFDPMNINFMIKNNSFRGDVTDVSA